MLRFAEKRSKEITASFVMSIDVDRPEGEPPQMLVEDVSRLLVILEAFKIPATWAITGRIFDENSELVDQILASRLRNDIGYHSYSHPDFRRIPPEMVHAELAYSEKIRAEMGIPLVSFTYPFNSIAYSGFLGEHGFMIYRGATGWNYRREQPVCERMLRGVLNKTLPPLVMPKEDNGVVAIGGSLYLGDRQMPRLLLPRFAFGLERAILRNRIFHVWLHPCDLRVGGRVFVRNLTEILRLVYEETCEGRLYKKTMAQIASEFRHQNRKKNVSRAGLP